MISRDTLTDRQVEFVDLIALGYSPDQISQRLQLSKWTVKGQLREIHTKLETHSIHEVAAWRWGFLDKKLRATNPLTCALCEQTLLSRMSSQQMMRRLRKAGFSVTRVEPS